VRSTLASMARSMRRTRLLGSSAIPELTGDGRELQSATPVSGATVNSERRNREEDHWDCRLFLERQFQNRPPLVIDDDGSCLKPHLIC
jgi:hypothetical protein